MEFPSLSKSRLIFGVFAWRMGFIDQDGLSAAIRHYIANKSLSLGDALVELGLISTGDKAEIQRLLGEQLEQHGGDEAKSWASLSVDEESLAALLDQSLANTVWQQIASICDRFEAAWKSQPTPPRLEDYLVGDWPEAQKRALLRDLLIVALDQRLAKGEQPQKEEYYQRFADYVEAIDDAFAAQEMPLSPTQVSNHESNQAIAHAADWHLLLGLLALQNGLISREQLVVAFAQWTSDKSKPLDQILVANEALDPVAADTLRQLVQLHVQQHGDDLQKTLMSLSGSDLPAAKEELARLEDVDVRRSIATLTHRYQATASPPMIGEATSTSGRFRILRSLPGAKGGMGEISIAEDEELGRHVALKQILSDKADQPTYRQKFQVEAEITGNLEHPGIVPIYGLGIGQDGRPYYAMRLVHGDNLATQIKQLHERLAAGEVDYSSVEFHGLVDRLIDVAQAIRYAHSRGVLHRDLKPGNILVGKYGETLVIDWGLARLLPTDEQQANASNTDSQLDSLPPLNIRSGSNVDATLQGQILGTVGYAPPEQLNGRVDLITERSDVYALGAILYQILLGEAPVSTQGKRQLAEVIRDTVEGRIEPPRRKKRAVPKALSAVCMKALEREPDKRYENVEDFISELENWKADQPVAAAPDSMADRVMRLARRYRAAVVSIGAALAITALVATIALVVVNRERIEKTQLAIRAGRAEGAARSAVNDYFVLVSESRLLNEPGMQESRKDLLSRALEYYLGFVADMPQKTTLDDLANAYFSLGSIQYELGDKQAAFEHMDLAIRGFQERSESSARLARAYQRRGSWLVTDNRFAEAESDLQAAIKLSEKNWQDTKSDERTLKDLTYSILKLSNLYSRTNQAQKARAEVLRASAILEDAPVGLRQRPTIQLQIANSYRSLSEMVGSEQSIAVIQQANQILEGLLQANPNDSVYRSSLAQGYESLGYAYRGLGQFAEAARKFQRCIEHRTQLQSRNPQVPEYLFRLAIGHDQLAFSLTQGEDADLTQAEASYQAALSYFEKILRQPENPYWTDSLNWKGQIQNGLAMIHRDREEAEECLEMFDRAEETSRILAEKSADNLSYQMNLGGTLVNRARACLRFGRFDDTVDAAEKAVDIFQRLDQPDGSKRPRIQLARAYRLLGDTYRDGYQKFAEAKEQLQRSAEMWKALQLSDPTSPTFAEQGVIVDFSVYEAEILVALQALKLQDASQHFYSLEKWVAEREDEFRKNPALFLRLGALGALVLSETSAEEERRALTSKIVGHLRTAKECGLYEQDYYMELLNSDHVLDVVRDSPQFQKLESELRTR